MENNISTNVKKIRPMLSVEGSQELDKLILGQESKLKLPLIAQPKYDGFRCLIINGQAFSRTMKLIPNLYLQHQIKTMFGAYNGDSYNHPLNYFDGEIISLDINNDNELPLHKTQSALSSKQGYPNFRYYVFDNFEFNRDYELRFRHLRSIYDSIINTTYNNNEHKRILMHVLRLTPYKICERADDIQDFEYECLNQGLEGIMLKSPYKKYKHGRSTLSDLCSIKIKRFTDDEASIIGFVEKRINNNVSEINELGYTKRSSMKENMVPADTLGALILQWKGIEFEIGTGWDHVLAKQLWDDRKNLIGSVVNFQYKGIGPNGKPLIPSFKAIRYDVY